MSHNEFDGIETANLPDVNSENLIGSRALALVHTALSRHSQPLFSPRIQLLGNIELLGLVFSFFDTPDENSANAGRDLLNASLTCKDFFHPAMDRLWRTIDSWGIVLNLIPTLVYIPSGGIREDLYTTTDILFKKDLERLQMYTRRIRHFEIFEFPESVSIHIFSSMQQYPHKLFPMLRTLQIHDLDEFNVDNISALYLMSSPVLSSILIGGISPSTEVISSSLLHSLSTEAHAIVEVHLSGRLSKVLLDRFADFSKLETLRLSIQTTVLDVEFLQKCSKFKNLSSLVLSLDSNSYMAPLSGPQRFFGFSTLRNLHISGPVFSISSILKVMQPVMLKSLSLDFTSLGPNSQWPSSTSSSVRECFDRFDIAPSLESFKVTAVEEMPINWSNLQRLQCCVKLDHLEAHVDYLTESKITSLCSSGSWGRLKSLRLEIIRVKSGEMGLWLYDLVALAQSCPQLTSLGISLSKIMHRPEDTRLLQLYLAEDTPWSTHPLESLHILPMKCRPLALASSTSSKTMAEAVVASRFIFKLFPSIYKLTFPEPLNIWLQGVQSMVEGYRAVRVQYDHEYSIKFKQNNYSL